MGNDRWRNTWYFCCRSGENIRILPQEKCRSNFLIMVQARSYPGGSAFPADADCFCLFDWFRLWVFFPWIEVLYADSRVATADSQYVPGNRFLWFGYCLSTQMDGLNVTLPCCGLVSFDVSDSCWCEKFYREAIDR